MPKTTPTFTTVSDNLLSPKLFTYISNISWVSQEQLKSKIMHFYADKESFVTLTVIRQVNNNP